MLADSELGPPLALSCSARSTASDWFADVIAEHGIRRRDRVALVGPNSPAWLAAYRALLGMGTVILLLDVDAPRVERQRWLDQAGGGRMIAVDGSGDEVIVSGERVASEHPPTTVLLPTSGTTGAPKLVARSVASLRAEGRRHQSWSGLTAEDEVVLALPMWHAYALGWVHAAIEAGAPLRPVPPAALAQCAQLINDGATVLPMVPVTARLLAARGTRTIRRDHRLRLAMVGAGPVNDELETCFRRGLGMGLARNYGSTETGALFSAGPGSPAGCVGHPLDGVEFRIVDNSGAELSPGNSGELVVRLDGGPWHPMGDLAVYQEDGLRPLGRRTRAFRRGDRWVAPEEIEAALLRHPDVVDARAFVEIRGRGGGTTIHAEVVHTRGIPASAEALRAHARTELAAHKVPDRIRLVGDLPRSSVGKPIPPRRIVLADADTLIACAQAYKRSELLFALLRLGVLERLVRGPATPAEVATALGVDREVCEQLMRVAEHVGLLQAEPPPGDPPVEHSPTGSEAADEAMRILRLEELLSRSWVTRERLTELGDTGMTHRAFDRDGPTEQLLTAYQQVMHSPAAYRRTRLGLSLAGDRRGARILEITCGPGRYIECAGSSTGSLCRVGPFAAASGGLSDIESLDTGQRFDLVVVCNAIHLPGPGSDLRLLARLLASTGRLLVDDVFMEVPAGLRNEVWLDWLTHGGVAWPTESSLLLGLARVGLTVERTVHVGRPACTVLLASIPGREADAATGVRLS